MRMPPSVPWSLTISSVSLAASFLVIRSKSPLAWRASSCSSRPMRFLIVVKLVSMPPSQRLLTYGWLDRAASWATGSWACFLVPTKRTWSPRATVSRTNSRATSSRWTVWARSMMWIPLRSAKMNGRILGFQRRVWWPKWTPASSSCRIETDGTVSDLLFGSFLRGPRRREPGPTRVGCRHRPGRNGSRVSSTPGDVGVRWCPGNAGPRGLRTVVAAGSVARASARPRGAGSPYMAWRW